MHAVTCDWTKRQQQQQQNSELPNSSEGVLVDTLTPLTLPTTDVVSVQVLLVSCFAGNLLYLGDYGSGRGCSWRTVS